MSRNSLLILFGFIVSCTSAPKKEAPPVAPEHPPETLGSRNEEENVDFEAVQRALGLDRALHQLGYAEKSFNTCEMGHGYSRSHNCRRETLAVIHFQLLCRDSQGTISTALTREDMQPLSGRPIAWSLHKKSGKSVLDHDGQGKIVANYRSSPKYQRLKLSANNDALYLKAGEIKRIVTPSNWCN